MRVYALLAVVALMLATAGLVHAALETDLHNSQPSGSIVSDQSSDSTLSEDIPNSLPQEMAAAIATLVGKLETETPAPTVTPAPEPTVESAPRAASPTPLSASQSSAPRQKKATASAAEPASGGPTERVWFTFYYCDRTVERQDDGGGFCGITATGTTVHPGTAACNPTWTQQGRSFIIVGDPSRQVYTCEDTGSAVHGNHIDIWFRTNGEGYSWPFLEGTHTIIWQ